MYNKYKLGILEIVKLYNNKIILVEIILDTIFLIIYLAIFLDN